MTKTEVLVVKVLQSFICINCYIIFHSLQFTILRAPICRVLAMFAALQLRPKLIPAGVLGQRMHIVTLFT